MLLLHTLSLSVLAGSAVASSTLSTPGNSGTPAPSGVRVEMSASNPRPQVGEEFLLYLDVLSPRHPVRVHGKDLVSWPLRDARLHVPSLDGVTGIAQVRPLSVLASERATPLGKVGFRLNDGPVDVSLDQGSGPPSSAGDWYRYRLPIPLRATQPGPVLLPGFRASGQLFVPAGSALLGGSLGQTPGAWRPFSLTSLSTQVHVVDLSARPDRPADFSGVLGEVQLRAQASQTDVEVGAPLTLTVRLTGVGTLERAPPPDLAALPVFNTRFRVRLDSDRQPSPDERIWQYVLRPLQGGDQEVPPVPLSYFNSRTQAFETARTDPVRLHVSEPAPVVAAVEPAAATVPSTAIPEPAPAPTRKHFTLEPDVVLGLLLIPLLGGVSQWVRRRRAAGAEVRDWRRLARQARRELRTGRATATDVRRTVTDYLRRRYRMPLGEITPLDAARRLSAAGVVPVLVAECAALLETCAAAEFAPGLAGVPTDDLARRGDRLLGALV